MTPQSNKGIVTGDNASFVNTQVGDDNTMIVEQTTRKRDAIRALDALLDELADQPERTGDGDELRRAALATREELDREQPDRARIDVALERLRDGAGSVASVANAVAAVGRAIGISY